MKKYFIIFLLTLLTATIVSPVLAVSTGTFTLDDYNQSKLVAEGDNPDITLPVIVGYILKGIISILGVLFLALLVYSGYEWMTSTSNEDKLKKAKTRILTSVIGLILMLSAYAITQFVLSQIADSTKAEAEMQQINQAVLERNARDQEYRDNIYNAIK